MTLSTDLSVEQLAQGLTLGDVLAQHSRLSPDRVATACGGQRWTYAELAERVDRLARTLRAGGVEQGERVLWLGQNCHRVFEGFLAAAQLGAMLCPVNWRLSPSEVAFVLDDLRPKVVLYEGSALAPWVAEVRSQESQADDAVWISADGSGPDDYEALLAAQPWVDVATPVDPATGAAIIYTAAFAGRPDGAVLTHRGLLAQASVLATVAGIDDTFAYLNCGPMFHLGTLMFTFATVAAGGKNVFVPRAEAAAICEAVHAERCHGGFILGPTINQIVELNADGRYDLSCLRVPPSKDPAWAAMTSPDDSAWGRRWSGYGQTEVTGMATYNALGTPGQGAHGRPSPFAALRIVDADDREVQMGECGQIVVRGPLVCAGYFNRSEENARRFRGGWWHTGDLGRIEVDGTLTFVGPAARMIKSAAENIYPAEVEAALESHPAVRECAVIGVPDPVWVQSVTAVVVLHEGAEASADELQAHVRPRLASYKKPRQFVFVDEPLPRAGFAKDYDALDSAHGGGNYPGEGAPAALG